MPVSCNHLDNYTPLFKISVGRRCREPVYTEMNKSRVLETHPPKWKCYKLIAQESNRRLGSAQLSQRKKSFSLKITTKISINILITSRILLLVTFLMALKGSALYSVLGLRFLWLKAIIISIIEILYTNLRYVLGPIFDFIFQFYDKEHKFEPSVSPIALCNTRL